MYNRPAVQNLESGGFISLIATLSLPPPHSPYFGAPLIVATTVRACFALLNSKYHIPARPSVRQISLLAQPKTKKSKKKKKREPNKPCHVPIANFPSVIGMVTVTPTNALLTWAYPPRLAHIQRAEQEGGGGQTGISSLPSSQCLYPPPLEPFTSPTSSGTMRSSASLMSARTSSS